MIWPVDPARYAAYAGVTFLTCAMPGPACLFALAVGARRGRRAMVAAVAGMNLGNVVWFIAAGLGLGTIASTAPLLFHALAWAGAAYVAWLGIKSLIGAWRGEPAQLHGPDLGGGSALGQGFVVQISNPKAMLFITAILPPFIDPARPVWPQIALLSATAISMDIVCMSAYGLGGAALATLMSEPGFRRVFATLVGCVLIAVSIMIARNGMA